MISRLAIYFISAIMFIAGYVYYPKWKYTYSEAAISWDVSGYYHYLPGIFIYHDLKKQHWVDSINSKYLPSPAYDQAFVHAKSGNKVNKYFIGQAILFSPGFFLAHTYTKIFKTYPSDGYSRPYQVAVWLSSLIFSILGLWLLRKGLLEYFDDGIVAGVLVLVSLGTHYLEYAAISNGMNHTYLFTLLSALILFTIRFYKTFDWIYAIGIGLVLGLCILTRPTEMIFVLVPLLWGFDTIRNRLGILRANSNKILLAFLVCLFVASIQPIYWKFISGEWLIYTYRDQGFDWFHPKIYKGLFGVQIGWWAYTPIMLVAMFGWHLLYKKHRLVFWPGFITSMLAIYITLCWPHFTSGGGLGQRNLIQIYPLLSFPLAALLSRLWWNKKIRIVCLILCLGFIYYSLWWVHNAHRGGFFQAGQMTTEYFMRVVGRLHPNKDFVKLLDTDEYFNGMPKDEHQILKVDFDQDTSAQTMESPMGGKCVRLDGANQFFGPSTLPANMACPSWLRLSADFIILTREWDNWKFTQWIVQFYDGEKVVKTKLIRVQRLIPADQKRTHIYFDVKVPAERFTKCNILLWNGSSNHTILMDNLEVTCISH